MCPKNTLDAYHSLPLIPPLLPPLPPATVEHLAYLPYTQQLNYQSSHFALPFTCGRPTSHSHLMTLPVPVPNHWA